MAGGFRDADDVLHGIEAIGHWLNTRNGVSPHEVARRVVMVGEGAGKVMAAYIGISGEPPYRGVTHTKEGLVRELVNVAITALVAVVHFSEPEEDLFTLLMAEIDRVCGNNGIAIPPF